MTTLISRGDVLLTAGAGRVGALHSVDGRMLWTLNLSDKQKSDNAGRAPMMLKGMLAVPTSTALVFVDPASGRAHTAWNPGKGITATPTRSGSRLYVLSNLGTVFAMRLKGGGNQSKAGEGGRRADHRSCGSIALPRRGLVSLRRAGEPQGE